MAARSGASFDEVLEAGRRAVAADQLMPGVADLIDEIRLEVLLDEGQARRPAESVGMSDPSSSRPGATGSASR